jgi:hypothetical protein
MHLEHASNGWWLGMACTGHMYMMIELVVDVTFISLANIYKLLLKPIRSYWSTRIQK